MRFTRSVRRVKKDSTDMMGRCVRVHGRLFGGALPQFSSCCSPVDRITLPLACRAGLTSRLAVRRLSTQASHLRSPKSSQAQYNKPGTVWPPRRAEVAMRFAGSFGTTRLCFGSRPIRFVCNQQPSRASARRGRPAYAGRHNGFLFDMVRTQYKGGNMGESHARPAGRETIL